jgi:hypothetical protein
MEWAFWAYFSILGMRVSLKAYILNDFGIILGQFFSFFLNPSILDEIHILISQSNLKK